MSFFLVFFITVAGACALAYLTQRSVGMTAAVINLTLIFTLYFCGLFKRLDVGMYVFFACIALLLGVATGLAAKKKDAQGVLAVLKSPMLVFYVTMGVAFGLALYRKTCTDFDELSHWGIVVKNMIAYNDFGNLGDTTTMFNRYVPATGIFMYGFHFFNADFANGNLYAAMDILIISLLMPLSDRFGRKPSFAFFASFLTALFVILCQRYSVFHNILVDGIQAIMGAYIYFAYMADRGKADAFTVVGISLGVFALVSTKSTGLPVAIFALVFILLDVAVRGRGYLKTFFDKKARFALILLPVLMIVFAKVSWNMYATINETRAGWNASELTFGAIVDYLKQPDDFQKQVTELFLRTYFIGKFRYDGGSLQQPMLFVFAAYALLSAVVCVKRKKAALGVTYFLSTLVMLIGYAVSSLLTYLFSFSYEEASRLASYARYYSTPLIFMSLVWTCILFDLFFGDGATYPERTERAKKKKTSVAPWTAPALIFFTLVTVGTLYGNAYCRQETAFYETKYAEWIEAVSTLKDTDRVYYALTEKENAGWNTMRVRFYATPTRCSGYLEGGSFPNGRDGWSFVGDPFSVNSSAAKLREELKRYDYFFIDDVLATDKNGATMKDKFAALADDLKAKTLYVIEKEENGDVIGLTAVN